MGLISAGDRCTPTLNLPELRIRKVYTKRKKEKIAYKTCGKEAVPRRNFGKNSGNPQVFLRN